MRNLSRTLTTALLTVAKAMALMASLAMAASLSRLLGKSDYGAFRQVLMIYAMSSIVLRVGIPQSIYYFLPRMKSHEQRAFVIQSLCVLLLQGAIFGLGLYFGSDALGRVWHSEQLPPLLRAFAFYPLFMLPIMAVENVLMTFQRIGTVFWFNILTKIAAFFVVVTPVYLGYSMTTAIRGWVLLAFIELVIAIALMLSPLERGKLRFCWARVVEQYKYAYPFGVAAVLGAVGFFADKIAVSTLGGSDAFADYANGAFELPAAGVISGAVAMALLPPMVRYAKEGQTELFLGLWHRSQTKVALVLYPFFGYFIFFAQDAITLLFSRRYSDSAILFQIFLCMVPIRVCSFGNIMVPLGKSWLYAFAHLVQLIVAYGLCFTLYGAYGLPGAAVGILIAVYANIAVMGWGAGRALQLRYWDVWPVRILATNLLIALLCGVVSYAAVIAIPDDTYWDKAVRLTVGAVVYGISYLLATWLLGLFKWREWHEALKPSRRPVGENEAAQAGEAEAVQAMKDLDGNASKS